MRLSVIFPFQLFISPRLNENFNLSTQVVVFNSVLKMYVLYGFSNDKDGDNLADFDLTNILTLSISIRIDKTNPLNFCYFGKANILGLLELLMQSIKLIC